MQKIAITGSIRIRGFEGEVRSTQRSMKIFRIFACIYLAIILVTVGFLCPIAFGKF